MPIQILARHKWITNNYNNDVILARPGQPGNVNKDLIVPFSVYKAFGSTRKDYRLGSWNQKLSGPRNTGEAPNDYCYGPFCLPSGERQAFDNSKPYNFDYWSQLDGNRHHFRQEEFHMVKGTGGSVQRRRNGRPRRGKRNVPRSSRNSLYMDNFAPVSVGTQTKVLAPRVSSSGNGIKRVVHRELFAIVTGTTGYACTVRPLNPGLAGIFPWLSSESMTYEMYRWKNLRFIYVPSCATTTTGVIGMAIDFDSNDSAPSNEYTFSSIMDAVETSPFESVVYVTNPINFNRQFPNKFVRYSEVDEGENLLSYDLGQFLFYTFGQSGTNPIGRIYVEYDTEFFIPQLHSIGGGSSLQTAMMFRTPKTTAQDSTHWFGTNFIPQTKVGSMDAYITSAMTIQFDHLPIGSLLRVIVRITGTVVATESSMTVTAGGTVQVDSFGSSKSVSATNSCSIFYVLIQESAVHVIFSGTSFTTLVPGVSIYADVVPVDFLSVIL